MQTIIVGRDITGADAFSWPPVNGGRTPGTKVRVDRPEVTALIEAAVHELDISVHEIRDAIFGLHGHTPARDAAGLRGHLLERVAASAELLGFTPGLPSAAR